MLNVKGFYTFCYIIFFNMGIRLKELRTEKGLKLKEVADALGLTISAISNYEQGLREPSIEILKKFCDLYDVSADYIIGRVDSY